VAPVRLVSVAPNAALMYFRLSVAAAARQFKQEFQPFQLAATLNLQVLHLSHLLLHPDGSLMLNPHVRAVSTAEAATKSSFLGLLLLTLAAIP